MTAMLEGLVVADLSIVTAGAAATQVLADFGADVIKIEGVDRPDMYRGGIKGNQAGDLGDLGFPPFRVANRNKRGIAIDLKTPEGLAIVRRIIEQSDVVVENFRRGVIERLGLGFSDLVKIKPDIVLVSISSQGATGPNAGFTSFGATLDALGGVMSLTGYDADTPTWSSGRINYPDQTANTLGAPLILAATMASRADGQPRWVDLSQREVVTSLLGEWILKSSLGDPDPIPMANSAPGEIGWCSPTLGEDQWIAISIDTPQARASLAHVVGVASQGLDESALVAELRVATDIWASSRTRQEASALLQQAGVAAVPVNSGEELLDDEYLQERGWWQSVELPDGSTEKQRGWVVDFEEGGPERVGRRAPRLGEHSVEILGALGYTTGEIEDFISHRIIGTAAVPAQK